MARLVLVLVLAFLLAGAVVGVVGVEVARTLLGGALS